MNYVILFFLVIFVIEILGYIRIKKILGLNFKLINKIINLFNSENNDTKTEKVVFYKSKILFFLSLKIFVNLILIMVLIYVINLYFYGFINFLIGFKGFIATLIFALIYILFKKNINDKL
ncbi:hypothetical protein AKH21_00765 [Pelagibacteraceae bacterium GOM-A5]|nr:hypothetical protein AKH21_00765 [Pelagibacteraceae bacterium GOM-A5]